jgi:hypothetical protein
MSKVMKIALIIAVAAITIGAKHLVSPATQTLNGEASTARMSISPEELTRDAGVLPETKVDSYF